MTMKQLQQSSAQRTSINLGDAADSVSQQDYRMADLPIERIPDSVTRVNVVAQQQGAPTITLTAETPLMLVWVLVRRVCC